MKESGPAAKPQQPALVLILGDQLSPNISSLKHAVKSRDLLLMVEVMEEATYVRHHKKKIALIFSAMRHFAESLRKAGWTVQYVKLDDWGNAGSFGGEVQRHAKAQKIRRVVVTEPGEWRVRTAMNAWPKDFKLDVDVLADDRFVCGIEEFKTLAKTRKTRRMEFFYRDMRRKTGLLMDGEQPVGGKWNFDFENRKPARADLFMPDVRKFKPDKITRDVLALVETRFADHFGELEPFWFATTAEDAEAAFEHFLAVSLARFGDFQDAMLKGEKFLYHSVVSMYLNLGLLDPLDLCRRVEQAYRDGAVPLNAAEGFIRQIIGWREFVRGIYWMEMPGYSERNFLNHRLPLPDFYWTGETDMACVKAAVEQTWEEAYAHHIQRLMVTGNFALLAGIDPKRVHEWYLIVYADAYEWVELPNTLGMSQFGDGGLLASKPYISSGAYINRMSDYCRGCRFDVKARTGATACPFNALYWDFLDRHTDKLARNPRLGQPYRLLHTMSATERKAIAARADDIRSGLTSSGDWA